MLSEKRKKAHRQYMQSWREANPKKALALQREWRRKNVEKVREYRRKTRKAYRAKHRAKRLAWLSIQHGLKHGTIVRPDHCTRCGVICTPEGHHPDYSKRREVIWLCGPCHALEHKRLRALKRRAPTEAAQQGTQVSGGASDLEAQE